MANTGKLMLLVDDGRRALPLVRQRLQDWVKDHTFLKNLEMTYGAEPYAGPCFLYAEIDRLTLDEVKLFCERSRGLFQEAFCVDMCYGDNWVKVEI